MPKRNSDRTAISVQPDVRVALNSTCRILSVTLNQKIDHSSAILIMHRMLADGVISVRQVQDAFNRI